jgi:hypothetical protein
MFILFWGRQTRTDRVGAVADWCDNCRRVTVFDVSRESDFEHIMFIRVGRPRKLGSFCRCWECGESFRCKERDYETFLTDKEVTTMSVRDVLFETNELLAKEETEQKKLNRRTNDMLDEMPRVPKRRSFGPYRRAPVFWLLIHWVVVAVWFVALFLVSVLVGREITKPTASYLALGVQALGALVQIAIWHLSPRFRTRITADYPEPISSEYMRGYPSRWVRYTVLATLVMASVILVLPEMVRRMHDWPVNPSIEESVVGPGDTVKVYLPQEIETLKGYWVGTPRVELIEPADSAHLELSATSSAHAWPKVIEDKSSSLNNHLERVWVDVTIPSEQKFAGRAIKLDIELAVRYPQKVGKTYDELEDKFQHQQELQIARDTRAGHQYMVWWWVTFLVSCLLSTLCGSLLGWFTNR